jgi:hypothetical protein
MVFGGANSLNADLSQNYVCRITVESYNFKCRNRYIKTYFLEEPGDPIIEIPLNVEYRISVIFYERCEICPFPGTKKISRQFTSSIFRNSVPSNNTLTAIMKYSRLTPDNRCSI